MLFYKNKYVAHVIGFRILGPANARRLTVGVALQCVHTGKDWIVPYSQGDYVRANLFLVCPD